MSNRSIIKGRGAQTHISNRFDRFTHESDPEFLEFCRLEGEEAETGKTKFLEVFPKSIVNKVDSPDVGMEYSMNPYQGCEHGCVYCYARNTHEYWGYNPGLDFEKNILIKKNAALLLEEKLKSRSWKGNTIVLSGNTDCYQPAEQKYRLTRECLKVFLKYRHCTGIITKNAFLLRDLDLLTELNHHRLIGINISITTLDENLRRMLEPRTASIAKRLQTVKILTDAGIPVNVMIAPIIPALNSQEILPLAEAAADHGASSIGFTVVRLNGAIGRIFTEWAHTTIPDRAERVLNQIKACHGGQLNDSRFGVRSKGEGEVARQLHQLIALAKRKYFRNQKFKPLNHELYTEFKTLNKNPDQLRLFQ
ncbi:PA0069 family radical SAM protein [Robertkochia solimangrovi]|uniref:PA0069 family radical SAM protein n=1 Tax=Robertkochia solimangrovi TaxID=2213046 RepID=UPI00117FB3C3|nr:PA0069 family radical SAM protein [Robertkochia solimangrovi]TRZ46267.1 radical SAM protein [Robertkochia solimangrovi]